MRNNPIKKPLSLYWARLTQRSPSYLLFWVKHRIEQRFIDPVWLSRLYSAIQRGNMPIRRPYRGKDHSLDVQKILTTLEIQSSRNFYFGGQERSTFHLEYNKFFPENQAKLIEEANDLLKGEIHYAGEIFSIGNEPNWYIPHQILINYLYHNSFEAFHWLKLLGKAYWLTNNSIYAEHATKWLNLWLDTIPYHFQSDFWKDINFIGTRALNLLSSLILFSNIWSSDIELVKRLLEQIYFHGTLLERRLEYAGANHLIWQAHDLALLGLALDPILNCAGVWRTKGLDILKKQVNRQYYPDGINFELSIGYQVFVTKLVGEVISTFWKAGISLPPQIIWRFKQSINAIEILLRPDSRLPLYGDSYRSNDPNLETSIDGAVPLLLGLHDRLFPEETRESRYDSPVLPWLMGSTYIWDNGNISQLKTCLSCAPESGVAVLKGSIVGKDDSSLYACIQAGKSEQGQVHAHADTLSLELADNNGVILIDPGAYIENSNPLRTYFRSTLAHNTIRIDQQDISQVSDTFYLWPSTSGLITGCYQNKELVAIETQHTNYKRLKSQVLHQRVIVLWRAKYMVILDKLTGKGSYFVERMFHFAPGELNKIQDQWHWQANGRGWFMINTSTENLEEEIAVGRESSLLGWYSEYRGKRVECPTILQMGNVVDTLKCITVLAVDRAGISKAAIDSKKINLNENSQSIKFNIGNLIVSPFKEGCEFNWSR